METETETELWMKVEMKWDLNGSHDSKKIINQRTALIADGTIGFLWLLLYR